MNFEHHDIALHHLIRQKTNKFHRRILQFDRFFAKNQDTPENVNDEQVNETVKYFRDTWKFMLTYLVQKPGK